jgi:hypothetical protein
MAYADDLERALPVDQLRMTLIELYRFVQEANNDRDVVAKNSDKSERAADERARRLAEAHAKGWEQVARAIDSGFRDVAQAIRDSNR